MQNRKFTDEHKKKISLALKRYNAENPNAIEVKRQRMAKLVAEGKVGFAKGNKARVGAAPWNKGKTAATDERVRSGQTPWNYKGGNFDCVDCGKKLGSRQPKNKLCSRCFGKRRSGENAPNWKGGITAEYAAARNTTEYKNWRKAVFERDNYTCVLCGVRGVEIQADHIKSFAEFPELRTVLSNGRTLCVPCHKTTPNYCRNIRAKV